MDAGLDVTLATLHPFEPLNDHAGLRIRSLGERPVRASFRPLHWLRRGLGQIQRWIRLYQIMREVRPELVHLHNAVGVMDFLGLRFVRALGLPVVLTPHEPRSDTTTTPFDWARYRAADAVIVHSTNGINDLVQGGIKTAKIRRVHLGNFLSLCPASDLSPSQARQLVGLGDRDRVILFFGTVAPYKGLDTLIHAFAQIAADEPDVKMIIAGEPLEPFTSYQTEIERAGVADRVVLDLRYIPFVELPKYFLSADVVAFPYRRIYQSAALQFAYGYGRAVVVTDVGGLGEAVAQDQSGLVVPPGDSGALATAIRRLLRDSASQQEMGRRGRRAAETKYSWQAVARDIIEIYRGVLENSPANTRRIPASSARRS